MKSFTRFPWAIVPYRLYAYQREATNLADSVRQTDDRTHVKGSVILASYGDEPGVGGGVISGTHNAECTPKTWSESVFAEDRNVVRHLDEWWMNRKNTWGRLYYTKDMSQDAVEEPQNIAPKMAQPDASMYEASYTGEGAGGPNAPQGQQYAQEFLFLRPGPAYLPPEELAPEQLVKPTEPATQVAPKPVEPPKAPQTETPTEAKPQPQPQRRGPQPPAPGLRSSGDCKLVPHKENVCPNQFQRHHVVANRSFAQVGLSGQMSRDDGLTFCLSGQAFPRAGGTGHAVAQQLYDFGTAKAAATSPDGKLSLADAEDIGSKAAAAGALVDQRVCSAASFRKQLRSYHQAHGLSPSTRVNP